MDPRIGRWGKMNTDLEVIPLKVRLRLSALVLTAFATVIASPLFAQNGKTGDRVMVPTLQSSDKDLGVQAAEAIRNQLEKLAINDGNEEVRQVALLALDHAAQRNVRSRLNKVDSSIRNLLLREIKDWENLGIIDQKTAEVIRRRYDFDSSA